MNAVVRHDTPFALPADACVVFASSGDDHAEPGLAGAPSGASEMVRAWLRDCRFSADTGEVTAFPAWGRIPAAHLIVAGVGRLDLHSPWRVEKAAAAAARWARRNGLARIVFPLSPGLPSWPETPAAARLIVRGAHDGQFEFERFRSDDAAKRRAPLRSIALAAPEAGAAVRASVSAGLAEGEVLEAVRDLANRTGNEAYPESIAVAARRLAARWGLRCHVLDRSRMERLGFGALLSVGRGSRRGPRLIALEYPGRRRGARPVVLVGKTITFDSGGLSLKPGKGMEWMKFDKSGGMAVLAAALTAARLRLPVPVVALLAAAENMPGGDASRPGDIVRSVSGKTIEIVNTDAEGRLVLADALTYAGRFKPRAIVDIATLTGAVVVALGRHAAGLLSPDDALAAALCEAGERSGDRLWRLPLWPEYERDLKTPHADVRNTGDGTAGAIFGAAFLRAFVPKEVPWAHLDIAGCAWEEKEVSARPTGATLFGVRAMTEWLSTLQP